MPRVAGPKPALGLTSNPAYFSNRDRMSGNAIRPACHEGTPHVFSPCRVPGGSDPGRLQYVEVEAELRDAARNARLAAADDSRAGQPLDGPVEAEVTFRDWAQRVSIRIAALRSVDRGSVAGSLRPVAVPGAASAACLAVSRRC